MKLKSYVEALTQDPKAAEVERAPLRAAEAKAQLDLRSAQLEGEILNLELEVNKIASRYPLDSGDLLDALDNLALAERQREQLNAVKAQLFPTA